MHVSVFCCLWIVLGASSALGPYAQTPGSGSVADLLDRYARGDHETAAEQFATIPGRRFRRELDRVASTWVRPDQAGAETRRLVAASLALEAAGHLRAQWSEARELIEWGCRLLEVGPPHEAERFWHLAVIYLAQGAGDSTFLLGPPWESLDLSRAVVPSGQRGGSEAHLDHAAARFPDEARFALARVVAIEFESSPGPRHPAWMDEKTARMGLRTVVEHGEPGTTPRVTQTSSNRWSRHYIALWDIVHLLEPLLHHPSLGAEARVRLGHTYLRLARPDRALEQLQQVEALTNDRFLIYLARYFTGRAQQVEGNRTAAVAAYRTAIDVVPAQSAGLALASLLFTADARDDAFALAEGILSSKPPEADPWRLYAAGDFRLWPALIERLRMELK